MFGICGVYWGVLQLGHRESGQTEARGGQKEA